MERILPGRALDCLLGINRNTLPSEFSLWKLKIIFYENEQRCTLCDYSYIPFTEMFVYTSRGKPKQEIKMCKVCRLIHTSRFLTSN